jgi:hypothetical protein
MFGGGPWCILGEPGRGPGCGDIFIPGGGGSSGLGEEEALLDALGMRGLLTALEVWCALCAG